MHTSLQGKVPLEAGLQQHVFIRIRKYYTRLELNEEKRAYQGFPPGHRVPDFGKYLEEGRQGGGPKPDGRVKFTASQSLHWLEHGTAIMERIFKRKARS